MTKERAELPAWVRQPDADVALEWGAYGLRALVDGADAVVVFDILRFTTTVDVAVSAGLRVLAHRGDREDDAAALARRTGAVLAAKRGPGPSLSPGSLSGLSAGTRLILPSPNGSALIVAAAAFGARTVIAACLRNADAVAESLRDATRVALIPAGERWHGATGPLRPAIEDLLGAGAVASALQRAGRRLSPEADLAAIAFEGARHRLAETLRACASGRELIERGAPDDVDVAAQLDFSTAVPTLVGEELVAGDVPDSPAYD